MHQGHGAPAAKRGMDERRLGGSAPDNCLLTASEQYTSSLIGDVSSHRLGRSSGRPFVYGPSLACPQRVSQVSMGTMVCFLANASISPQPGSGNLAAGEWSEAYQSTWALLALPSRVFLCWRPRQGANLQP